jgi:hypothetical protein
MFSVQVWWDGLPNFGFISTFSVSKIIHVHPHYVLRCKISSEVFEFISGPDILRYLIVLLFLGLKKKNDLFRILIFDTLKCFQ